MKKRNLKKIKSINKTILLTIADLTLGYFEFFERPSRFAFPLATNLRKILRQNRYDSREIANALHRLKRQNSIQYDRQGDDAIIKITSTGRKKVLAYNLEEEIKPLSNKWDQKWRIVIFDVPEKKKSMREAIRNTLSRLGFCRIQDSVWIFPWECKEVIEYLRELYVARPYIRYLEATYLDFDNSLRRHFQLKS